MKSKIKTAFIFDPMSDIKDEVEGALLELNALCNLEGDQRLPIKIVYQEQAITSKMMEQDFDLLIIDYGGMSWGNASGQMQLHAACQYAEDHPNCLVVIWTGYTANIYQDELSEQFGYLKNVQCRYEDSSHVYGNLDGSKEFLDFFHEWFKEEIEEAKKQKENQGKIPKLKLKKPGRP